MTGNDLIVVAPWIAFAAALAVVYLLVLRSDRASRAGRGVAGQARARGRQPRKRRASRPRRSRGRPSHGSAEGTDQGNHAHVCDSERSRR